MRDIIFQTLADTQDVNISEAYVDGLIHFRITPKNSSSNSISINLDTSGASFTDIASVGGGSLSSSQNISSINGYSSLQFSISSSNPVDLLFNAYGNQVTFDAQISSLKVNGKRIDTSNFPNNMTLAEQVTNHHPTGTIAIVGNAKEGETLTINNTLADVDGLGVMSYQWLSDNKTVGANNSYILSAADIGKKISVKASYTDGGGTTETAASGLTDTVAKNISTKPTAGNDQLTGTNGNDKLSGLGGDDMLIGGMGADTLTGGKGADVFKFNDVVETGITLKTRDTIKDFNHKEGDKIDLSAIDANVNVTSFDKIYSGFYGNFPFAQTDQAFTFIGNQAFSKTDATGQLRFDATTHILYGSINADNKPEFSIVLSGVKSLVADDFIL